MGKKKTVTENRVWYEVKQTKQVVDPQSYDKLHPSWRFSKLISADSKWSFYKDGRINSEIIERLKDRELSTWGEIKNSQTQKSHNVSVSNIIKTAQQELFKYHIYEDEIFSLRISGRERVWGVLDCGVLEILWYDPNHEICPSHKK